MSVLAFSRDNRIEIDLSWKPNLFGFPKVISSTESTCISFIQFALHLVFFVTAMRIFDETDGSIPSPATNLYVLCIAHIAINLLLLVLGPGWNPFFLPARLLALRRPLTRPQSGYPLIVATGFTTFLLTIQAIYSFFFPPTTELVGRTFPYFLAIGGLFNLLDSISGGWYANSLLNFFLSWRALPSSWTQDLTRTWSNDEVNKIYIRWVPAVFVRLCEMTKESTVYQLQRSEDGIFRFLALSWSELSKRDAPASKPLKLLHRMQSTAELRKLSQVTVRSSQSGNQTIEANDFQPPYSVALNKRGVNLFSSVQHRLDAGPEDIHSDSKGNSIPSQWKKSEVEKWKKALSIELCGDSILSSSPIKPKKLNFIHPLLGIQSSTVAHQTKHLGSNVPLLSHDKTSHVSKLSSGRSLSLKDPSYLGLRNSEYSKFLREFPDFELCSSLTSLREQEYPLLDKTDCVYLDYTAGGLPARSQLDAHMLLIRENVLGNPHSACPTSLAAAYLDSSTRETILNFFDGAQDTYDIIFTMNASGALKVVAENFPFTSSSTFLYLEDNHNSTVGIREWAFKRGADVLMCPLVAPELRVDEAQLMQKLQSIKEKSGPGPHLFAFPAQSNLSGVKHPLKFISMAKALGWHVLVDTAAYVPTNRFSLNASQPDFATISFYKIFGYPTGIGCLIAKKSCLKSFNKTGFAGGTVKFVTTNVKPEKSTVILEDGHARFEEGTVNYLLIPAVSIGLKYIEFVGMEKITMSVKCLTGWLLKRMLAMKHPNGAPLIRIYGPENTKDRGGTISISILDINGKVVNPKAIELEANAHNVNVRVGCFCNPGAAAKAMNLSKTLETLTEASGKALETESKDVRICGKACRGDLAVGNIVTGLPGGESLGMIRISIGIASNFDDVYRMALFLESFSDEVWVSRVKQDAFPFLIRSPPNTLC